MYTYDDLGNRTSMVVTTPGTIDYYCDNDQFRLPYRSIIKTQTCY
ncbi:MAG TPA: hypothetical protein ENH01_05310 [Nitrospirae bacterium]|nr:hypothetical protein [Nitrospirota bacterium]